jgi:alpha-galactosidase
MGIPAARQYITDTMSNMITEHGVDIFREDFNIDPLLYWREYEPANRQGYTEAKYIEGFYQFWDDLLARHPGLVIDNCASGGRRIDLETIRRSVPLWRSDLQCCDDYNAVGSQCQTFGMAYWLPLNATGSRELENSYDFRSAISAGCNVGWKLYNDEFPADWGRTTIEQAVQLRDFFYGDFYPLTSYSLSDEVWLAYQLDRPDLGMGVILAYRREKCPYPTANLKLKGLNPAAGYELKNLDTKTACKKKGQDLMEAGITLTISAPATCTLIVYKTKRK